MTGERDAVAEVLAAHWEIDVDNGGDQTEFLCDGCKATLLVDGGDVDAAHRAHVADVLAGVIAAKQAEALREAGDDQVWWLTEAMDGDFLIVDCGHIGHDGGRVGLSHARPTDLARWVRQGLLDRADRIEAER